MSEPDELTLGYHIVCLIDVLGQKERLAGWRDLPENGRLSDAQTAALKKTVGVVLGFSEVFERFFQTVGQCTIPEQIARLTPQGQEEYRQFKDCDLKVQQFSDTFVFYARTVNAHGILSALPLYRILGACSAAMLLSLASHVPVRGAITVGAGIELARNNFYGPALAETHYLESEVAAYPRVVISPMIEQFIKVLKSAPRRGIPGTMMVANLQSIHPLLTRDDDDRFIVDFMGEGLRGIVGTDHPNYREVICKGYEFVRGEVERFGKENNVTLSDRYEKLRRYMERRMPLWLTPGA